MLLYFLSFLHVSLQQDFQNVTLPYYTKFEGQISEFITSKNESDVNSTHNCLIVPCTVVDFKQKCIVVTKKTHGGDCFTRYFNNPTDLANPNDALKVEFDILFAYHPQSTTNNAGFVIGYTDDIEQFKWIGAEDANMISDGKQGEYQAAEFVTINKYAKNTWSRVRINFKPNNTNPIRLVFEAYDAATDFAGQFLITNFSIFHRGECSDGCLTCQSYFECTSCESGKLYKGACLSDLCFYDATSLSVSQVSRGWILQDQQLYGIKLTDTIISQCYGVKFIFNKIKESYINGSNPSLNVYQYGYLINEETLKDVGCEYFNTLESSQKSGYICNFYFSLYMNNTETKIVEIEWNQEFYYETNGGVISGTVNSEDITYLGLSETADAGTATTRVKGQTLLCKTETCRTYYEEDDKKVLFLNQIFYILVKLDESQRDWGSDMRFSLSSAYVLGNGTLLPLELVEERDKNMSARIFALRVPAVVENCSISISAQLIFREYDENSGITANRRLLTIRRRMEEVTESTTQGESSPYQVSDNIQIESIQILPGWWVYKAGITTYLLLGLIPVFLILVTICLCLNMKRKLCSCCGNQGGNVCGNWLFRHLGLSEQEEI